VKRPSPELRGSRYAGSLAISPAIRACVYARGLLGFIAVLVRRSPRARLGMAASRIVRIRIGTASSREPADRQPLGAGPRAQPRVCTRALLGPDRIESRRQRSAATDTSDWPATRIGASTVKSTRAVGAGGSEPSPPRRLELARGSSRANQRRLGFAAGQGSRIRRQGRPREPLLGRPRRWRYDLRSHAADWSL
jgi:hypothetical protein